MNTALLLALALGLDAVMGEPKWLWARLPHPAVVMGRGVRFFDDRFNAGAARRVKGAMSILVLAAGAGLAGWLVQQCGAVVTVLAAAILLAQKSLVDHVAAVATGLRQSDQAGRDAVAMIVSRDVQDAPASSVARSAIESLSENFSDGVIAPAFWFLIGGLPALAIYKMVNTADSMVGYLTPRHAAFGWASARSDDLLNWIPARLTGALIALVGGVLQAWGAIARDAGLHRSPNAGWPEAAMARSLNIALAGPRIYHGTLRDLAWVNGDARQTLTPADIDDAVAIVWKAWAMAATALFIAGILLWLFSGHSASP